MGPVGTGLAIAGGSALAGTLLKKKTPKLPDAREQLGAIEAAGQRERDIASALPTKLAPLSANYQTSLKDALTSRQGEQGKLGRDYLSSFSGAADTASGMESNLLRQRVLDAQKGINRGLRENLAAGGQLQSGAGQQAFSQAASEAANQIAQGQTQIGIQNMQAKQQAVRDVFGADTNMVTQALGIDENMLTELLNSGRADLIREAQMLVEESRNTTANRLAAYGVGQDRTMASELSRQASQNDLLNALIGVGGQIGGAIASRR